MNGIAYFVGLFIGIVLILEPTKLIGTLVCLALLKLISYKIKHISG